MTWDINDQEFIAVRALPRANGDAGFQLMQGALGQVGATLILEDDRQPLQAIDVG